MCFFVSLYNVCIIVTFSDRWFSISNVIWIGVPIQCELYFCIVYVKYCGAGVLSSCECSFFPCKQLKLKKKMKLFGRLVIWQPMFRKKKTSTLRVPRDSTFFKLPPKGDFVPLPAIYLFSRRDSFFLKLRLRTKKLTRNELYIWNQARWRKKKKGCK